MAEALGADPMVLGAEGRSRMEHALIGSVSEEVLRHANRTVLVVWIDKWRQRRHRRPKPSEKTG